jgi:myosin-5
MSTSTPINELLWIPDDTSVYELAKIVQDHIYEGEQKEHMVLVETLNKKKVEKKLPRSVTYDVDKSHLVDLNDLIEMNSLHEGPLLDVLRRRWLKDNMYTYTGDFLVSINPYHQIANQNDNPLQYLDLSPKKDKSKLLNPHVFAIANNALREAVKKNDAKANNDDDEEVERKISQSIIVTGESGAGKTEASKQVMNFLTLANKEIFPSGGDAMADKIKNVILDSNVLFESFGNAKTVRNDNSSRFGKYIKLQYTEDNQLFAAHTETFLLEKSRLVSVGKDDRNYHIFYQLIRGIDNQTKTRLNLVNVDIFKILTDGGNTIITSEQDDINEFNSVLKALPEMGCTNDEITRMWELLACILHLGNINVNPASAEGQPVLLQSTSMPLEQMTNLLGVTLEGFIKAITVQIVEVKMRNEKYDKILSVDETKNNILALIKWLYGALFNWLVSKVNSAHNSMVTNRKKEVVKFIGILDIFGFEILLTNTFEQLCINYTNERLQQQFNELAFEVEQQEYAKEGLDWTSITYRDNQSVIDLIGKKPKGLLIILEEHSLMNREPDDQALLSTYHKLHFGSHPNYAKPKFGNEGFVIKHFAGEVTYNIASFIAKNNDSLQEDLADLLGTSGNSYIIDILKSHNAVNESFKTDNKSKTSNANANAGTKIASTISVSFRFRNQLDSLVTTLRSTKAFYIKCIKPNAEKKAGVFNAQLVITQLRYSGVLEIVRIRREGYPTRVPYPEFYTDFQELAHGKKWIEPSKCTIPQLKEYCRLLCADHAPVGSFQIGHNFLFLHHYVPQLMTNALHAARMRWATLIQTAFRRFVARRKYLAYRRSAIFIQSVARMGKEKKKVQKMFQARAQQRKESSTKIQAIVRGYRARKQHSITMAVKSVVLIQSLLRTIPAKKKLEKAKKASIAVQSIGRALIAKRKFQAQRQAAIVIQSKGREVIARRHFLKLLKAAIVIQSNGRTAIASKRYQNKRQ